VKPAARLPTEASYVGGHPTMLSLAAFCAHLLVLRNLLYQFPVIEIQVELGAKPCSYRLCSASLFLCDSKHRLGLGLGRFIFFTRKPILEPNPEQPFESFE
jgi:hypothetical protein